MSLAKSIALLLGALIPTAILHRLVLSSMNKALVLPEYLYTYGANFFMATVIIVVLFKLPERLKSSMGYFFLFGSLLKFICYFVFFLPVFKEDGDLSKVEFFSFFVPYAVCLVIETTVLIAKLKEEDEVTERGK